MRSRRKLNEPRISSRAKKIMMAVGFTPVMLGMIAWELLQLLIRILKKFHRAIRRTLTMVLILYGLFSFFGQVAHAPKADASQPYEDLVTVSLPMKVNPDMKIREIVLSLVREEFGEDQIEAFDQIVIHESGWDPKAVNPNGGACGLFQALPCSKMGGTDLEDQIGFGFNYIKNRYGTPNRAWAFWQRQSPHWY